jgi:glycerol uptake facilitator-like aquaporin
LKRFPTHILVASLFALAGGAVAVYANVYYVKKPDTLMDWAVQLCGGLTFAIIIYFIVWGHFQERDQAE